MWNWIKLQNLILAKPWYYSSWFIVPIAECPPTQTSGLLPRHWENQSLTSADELQGNKMLSKGLKTQCSPRIELWGEKASSYSISQSRMQCMSNVAMQSSVSILNPFAAGLSEHSQWLFLHGKYNHIIHILSKLIIQNGHQERFAKQFGQFIKKNQQEGMIL